MLDQAAKLRQMAWENNIKEENNSEYTKVFTIASGKGGVGKSNLVINLAIALRKLGKNVLVLDADIGMANVDVLIGTIPKYTIFDVIYRGKTIEEVMINGPLGVKVLCGGTGLSKIDDLDKFQRDLLIKELGSLRGFDYILIDTGAGINRTSLAFIDCSDEIILVTTPEPTALTDAYSLLKTLYNHNVKSNAKVIVNRVLELQEGLNTFKRLQNSAWRFLNTELTHIGNISEDKKLVQAVRMQKPVILAFPKSDASRDIAKIAESLEGTKGVAGKNLQGIFKKMLKIFS